jgi:hypothetical protein
MGDTMLYSREMLEKIMSLDLAGVRAALDLGGFPDPDNEITKAEFQGFNPWTGQFMYRVTFPGQEEGSLDTGHVSLYWDQEETSEVPQIFGEWIW